MDAASSQFTSDWIGRLLGHAERRRVVVVVCQAPTGLGRKIQLTMEEFGGSIVDATPSRVAGCWGLTNAGGDYHRRAIQAALRVSQLGSPEHQPKCAIETGIIVASLGPDRPRITDAHCSLAQQAARLLDLAAPGEVVCGATARLIAEREYEIRPIASSTDAWRVISSRPDAEPSIAMVGHVAERQALDDVWLRIVDGMPQCVSIVGEAGIGKSRLLRYLEHRVRAARGLWVEIHCGPSAHPPKLAGPNQDLEWLSAQAAGGPTVVAVENIHNADLATIAFVAKLGERLRDLGPIGLVWTSRGLEPLGFRTTAQRTHLAPKRLSSSEVLQLLACSPFGPELSPAARKQIAVRSEGIPLFAIELARLSCELKNKASSCDLLLEPGPLNALLTAQLDTLGSLKALALIASVIGREFDVAMLSLVLQMDCRTLATSVGKLVASGILQPADSGGTKFRFAHTLTREVAYASVAEAHRSELHQRIASLLAQGDAGSIRPELVASHYSAAGDLKQAFSWWHKAGIRAAERSSARTAVTHLYRALAARLEDPEAGSIHEEVEVLRLLGVQLAAVKGNGAPEVLETLQRCLALSRMANGPDGDFDAMWTLHSCYLVRGEINQALAIGDQLTSSADRHGPEERRLRAHRMQGLAKLLGGHLEEAFTHYGLVLEIYDEARHAELRFQHASDQGALAHAHLAWGEAIAGRLESSARNMQAALRLSSKLQHPHTSAHVFCVLAARGQTIGDKQAASTLAYAGRMLGQRHEYPYWIAWSDIILGWTQGDRDADGLRLIEAAIRAYRRTGAAQALPYALLLLAETALNCNRPQQALAASEEGWALAQRHGLLLYGSELLRLRAAAELRLKYPLSQALNVVAEAEKLAANQGAETFRYRAAEFRTHWLAAV